MEAALQSPPPLQSVSDEDAYSMDFAKIHFGSFTTPPNTFTTTDDPQPPLPSNPEPQDSQPPTPQPDTIDPDQEAEQEDSEDVERVEELVGSVDAEGQLSLDTDIPFSADYVDDEPTSALALRISRAMDNPSPPPSPLPNESEQDTLPPEFTEADANDNVQDVPAEDTSAPPEIPPASPSPTPPQATDSHMDVEDPVPSDPLPPQQDLMTFDSISALEVPIVIEPRDDNSNPPDSAVSAVDALLLASPSSDSPSPVDPSTSEEPTAPTQDEPEMGEPQLESTAETDALPLPSTPPTTQPLRRSPRKSVAPVIFGTPQASPRPSSRSPKKKKPKFDSVVDSSQDESDATPENVLLPIQPNSTTATPRARERSRSRSPLVFSREVGSLSPTTSNLLTQLIPSFTDTTPLQLNAEEPAPSNDEPVSSQGMQTFSVFTAPPPPSDPQPSTPMRPSAPIRPMATPSPSKLRLGVLAQDANATPARRIPIEQALESGQLSPLKASQMGFKPQSNHPGLPQTPARRVLVSEHPTQAPSSAKPAIRIASPVRGRSQEPERSSQASTASTSSHIGIPPAAQRPVSAVSSHSIVPSSTPSVRPSKLPYPLVAAEKPPSGSTFNGKDTSKDSASISSPVKSNLKQVTSRIPRIGAKPYSRPPAAAKPTITKPTPAPAPVPAPASKTTTIRKVDLSKLSTTRMVGSRGLASSTSASLAKGKGKETAATTRSVAPATNLPSSSIPSASKRKRSPDKIPSPVKSRMPSSRQAHSSSTATTATAASTSRVRTAAASKKAAVQPTLRIRKVVDPVPPPAPVVPTPPPPPPPVPVPQQPTQQPTPQPLDKEPQGEVEAPRIEVTMPVDGVVDLGSPMKEDPPVQQPVVRPPPPPSPSAVPPPPPAPVPVSLIPVIQIDPPMDTPPIETLPPSEIPQPIQGVRRTTRLRKATVDCAGVNGHGVEPRASSRRKVPQGPRFVFTDAYSEMSATALKQLTMTNTVRNQHYLSARLETEVVRKDGTRPESPMVKIKTIAQRQMEQMEEQAVQRTERAKRRARRSGEMLGESDLEMDEDEDGDGEVASSDVDELPSWKEEKERMRHTRGAGEDEDYETPHRAFKRMKLTEGGLEEVEMDDEGKRRVKWDRGLFTTVYLDEVVLGERQTGKELANLKGCLAPTAKALRLDTLGNLEADAPLPELAPQNIVVKKFVFDGELVPEPVVEEVVVVPKTRSRSKKGKS